MINCSQSPRDRILWILAHSGGQIERYKLRRRMGMRYTLINPILEDLVKEGRIKISPRKYGDVVSLIAR